MRPKESRDEPTVQLATRVPRRLLLELRVWSVRNDVTMMEFIEDAIREKLELVAKK